MTILENTRILKMRINCFVNNIHVIKECNKKQDIKIKSKSCRVNKLDSMKT